MFYGINAGSRHTGGHWGTTRVVCAMVTGTGTEVVPIPTGTGRVEIFLHGYG